MTRVMRAAVEDPALLRTALGLLLMDPALLPTPRRRTAAAVRGQPLTKGPEKPQTRHRRLQTRHRKPQKRFRNCRRGGGDAQATAGAGGGRDRRGPGSGDGGQALLRPEVPCV